MKKILSLVILFFLIGSLTSLSIVQADDDEYEDDNEYEEYEDYEDYEDDEYYYDETNTANELAEGNWYIWNKDVVSNKIELPFKDAKHVNIKTTNAEDTLSVYVVPLEGEYFIPGKAVSQFLGATATFYEKSNILEVTSGEVELIFRSNTNVVYEKGLKMRMPGNSFSLNEDVYLPISVLANGLGYSVEWNEQDNSFVFQAL